MEPRLGDSRHSPEHAGRPVANRREPDPYPYRQGHTHQREEEWIYVISGRGVAEIDYEEFEVAAGDFMGFPTPSVAHHLRNPYDEELAYLVGGENLDVELLDFPRLGKRMLLRGQDVEIHSTSDAQSFGTTET